jgi:Uma2 family endonuclease
MSLVLQETWGPPTDKAHALYEYVGGEWKEVPPMGRQASLAANALMEEMAPFARSNRLGRVLLETLFLLAPEGPALRPALAFVSSERWPSSQGSSDGVAFEVVPNLAVEVNSPTNTLEEIHDKVLEYLFHGVQLVWVLLPRQRYAYVYESPEDSRGLSDRRELDGGSVLPGFQLSLAHLFGTAERAV